MAAGGPAAKCSLDSKVLSENLMENEKTRQKRVITRLCVLSDQNRSNPIVLERLCGKVRSNSPKDSQTKKQTPGGKITISNDRIVHDTARPSENKFIKKCWEDEKCKYRGNGCRYFHTDKNIPDCAYGQYCNYFNNNMECQKHHPPKGNKQCWDGIDCRRKLRCTFLHDLKIIFKWYYDDLIKSHEQFRERNIFLEEENKKLIEGCHLATKTIEKRNEALLKKNKETDLLKRENTKLRKMLTEQQQEQERRIIIQNSEIAKLTKELTVLRSMVTNINQSKIHSKPLVKTQ